MLDVISGKKWIVVEVEVRNLAYSVSWQDTSSDRISKKSPLTDVSNFGMTTTISVKFLLFCEMIRNLCLLFAMIFFNGDLSAQKILVEGPEGSHATMWWGGRCGRHVYFGGCWMRNVQKKTLQHIETWSPLTSRTSSWYWYPQFEIFCILRIIYGHETHLIHCQKLKQMLSTGQLFGEVLHCDILREPNTTLGSKGCGEKPSQKKPMEIEWHLCHLCHLCPLFGPSTVSAQIAWLWLARIVKSVKNHMKVIKMFAPRHCWICFFLLCKACHSGNVQASANVFC